jgi:phenylpropionate dioxygenase-like ring-hydroxylating dioxygenase large terminal subunit
MNENKQFLFPKSWYPLCRSSDVKRGRVMRMIAFGVPLAVYRAQSGRAGAMYALCPHMGADLSRGRVVGERLQCPLHEWQFGMDGRCEFIPATDDIPERAVQPRLVTHEQYGILFAFLGGEPTFPVPRFPADAAPHISRARVMEFDTPYQVLASNSYDAQHFISVHRRTLLEPPRVFSESPNHYGVSFRARVDGVNYNDRLLRAIGVREVELEANCYGGNTVVAYSGRTSNYIMFATLPITSTRSRIFVLNAMAESRAKKMPAPIRSLMLAVTHRLTLAFLHADIAVVDELQYKFGVLLPEADAGFIGWMRYWNALPRASVLGREGRSASENEADLESETMQ